MNLNNLFETGVTQEKDILGAMNVELGRIMNNHVHNSKHKEELMKEFIKLKDIVESKLNDEG